MSFFENNAVQALKGSLDTAWMKQQVSSHNVANSETPGFKAKKVSFEKILSKASEPGGEQSIQYKPVVTEDNTTSARPDGNNVSIEKEEMDLWQSYYQYSALTKRMATKFSNLRYVINNAGK